MENYCEGKCPKCGSEDINWLDSDLQDGFIVYNAVCNNCKQEFQEEYKLVYNVSVY